MKIPVILVTGFLGSGKTTFLRRYAEAHPDDRLIFLVNEFAPVSVDGPALEAFGTPTQSVVGGSLFCECKSADFIRVIRDIVLPAHGETPLDALVIETSGIADPRAIATLLSKHGLENDLAIERIVTIVAPAKFARLIENLDAVRAQVETSDVVVINKTDLATSEVIEETEVRIRALTPNTAIHRATHCQLDFDFAPRQAPAPGGQLSTCDTNPYSTAVLEPPVGIDHIAFLDWLTGFPCMILRLKGHTETDRGWFHVERTIDTQTIAPCPPQPQAQLIAIAHDDHAEVLEDIRESLARIQSAKATV